MPKEFKFNREDLRDLQLIAEAEKYQPEFNNEQFGDFSRGSIVLDGIVLAAGVDESKKTQDAVVDATKSHLNNDVATNLLLSAGGQSCISFINDLMLNNFYSKSDEPMNSIFTNASRINDAPYIIWKKVEGKDEFTGVVNINFSDNSMQDSNKTTNTITVHSNITLSIKDGKPKFKVDNLSLKADNANNVLFNSTGTKPHELTQDQIEKMKPIENLESLKLPKAPILSRIRKNIFKAFSTKSPKIQAANLANDDYVMVEKPELSKDDIKPLEEYINLKSALSRFYMYQVGKAQSNDPKYDEFLKQHDSINIRNTIKNLENRKPKQDDPEFSKDRNDLLVKYMFKVVGRALLDKDHLGHDKRGKEEFKRIAELFNNDTNQMKKTLGFETPESRKIFDAIALRSDVSITSEIIKNPEPPKPSKVK